MVGAPAWSHQAALADVQALHLGDFNLLEESQKKKAIAISNKPGVCP